MRSEQEIRDRIAFLTAQAAQPKIRKSLLPVLFAAEDALQWALEINDADENWSLQRRLDAEAGK